MDQAEKLRKMLKSQASEKRETNAKVAKVITVTSGKGGVGKSSLSVNLAIQLSRMGKRVIVFDADIGLANIEIMLGVRPLYNLADLMYRGKNIKDIITYGPENVGFISGGSGIHELSNLTKDQIYSLVHKLIELDQLADVIIVDTGAGISDMVLEFVAASEEILLVATPEPTSITDAYALLKTLNRKIRDRADNTTVKLVANQVNNESEAVELYKKFGIVVDKFLDIGIEELGSVPYDRDMQKAIMKQAPISISIPNAKSAKAIGEIARKLENIQEEPEHPIGMVRVFSRLIRLSLKKENK
ncbi:MAG: MinD/ParA family protein [Eubacterium sp.]|nr:MinD/ParA family protein [Eubacterium sp.]